jgi:hypothetical protein
MTRKAQLAVEFFKAGFVLLIAPVWRVAPLVAPPVLGRALGGGGRGNYSIRTIV